MVFKTLYELNETLMRNPISNYGWLQLDNYLAVVPEDEKTDNFLIILEDGIYPPL